MPVDWELIGKVKVVATAHTGKNALRLDRDDDGKIETGLNREWKIDSGEQGKMLARLKGGLEFWYQAPAAAPGARIRHCHPARLPPHVASLAGSQARLASLTGVLNRTMSLYLSSNVHFYVHALDVTSYEQYLRNLAATPILGVIAFDSGAPPALWEISAPLAYTALDCMLGGKDRGAEQPAAEAAAIERAILRRLFQEVLSS